MKNNHYPCVLILAPTACGPQEKISKEVFDASQWENEVKKSYQIFEIIEETMVLGWLIIQEAQKPVYISISKQWQKKGLMELWICNVNATTISRWVADNMGSAFEGCPSAFRNPTDKQN